MTTHVPTPWSVDPVAGSPLRRSVQITPAAVELVLVDRAVACGRLVTAAAASFAPAPTAPWARFTVLAAVVLLAAGGLVGLARPLVDLRARSGWFASMATAATTTSLAVAADVVAVLGLVVALGPGTGRAPTTAVLAFCLLPLLEAAVRYGLAGLITVWLAVVGSLAVAIGVAIVGGSRTTVLDALAPLGVLGILGFPVGLLVLALGSAIARFEVANEATRTRSRVLGELTRLTHDLAAAGGAGGAADAAGSEATTRARQRDLLLRCLGRLGFEGVVVTEATAIGLADDDLGVDEVPRIHAAEELVALGGPHPPASPAGRPVTCAFAAVSRLGALGPGAVVVGWSVADPLLAIRLEAFAVAVAAYRSATVGRTNALRWDPPPAQEPAEAARSAAAVNSSSITARAASAN